MTTNAVIGLTSTFAIYNGSSYVAVAEVTSFNVQYTRDAVEATHMTSPNGYREYVRGLKSYTLSLELNFVPSGTDVIIAALEASSGQYKLTYPGGANTVFYGSITNYSIQGPLDDKMTASVEIQGSGEPTEAAS